MKVDLLSKIEECSAKIGIIGLGYVGSPLALRFCEENFKVIGFDSDPQKVKMLNEGISNLIVDTRNAIKKSSSKVIKA